MVRINKKYQYKKHNRFQSETGRKYLVDEAPVPSVTTILSATKNSKGLDDWRRRVGNEEADRIMKNASSVSTLIAWRFALSTASMKARICSSFIRMNASTVVSASQNAR